MTIANILSSKWTKVVLFLACAIPFMRLAPPVLAALNLLPDSVANAMSQSSFFVMIGPNPVEFITHYTGDWTLRALIDTGAPITVSTGAPQTPSAYASAISGPRW